MKNRRSRHLKWLGIIIPVTSLVVLCGLGTWAGLGWSGLLNRAHTVNVGYVVRDLAISPDGKLLASVNTTREYYYNSEPPYSDAAPKSTQETQSIQLRQVTDGQLIRTLVGHTDYVRNVAFSPDGKLLASSSADQTVKIWNVDDGSVVTTLPVTPWPTMSLAWSPDSGMLVLGSGTTVGLWQVQDWRLRTTFQAGASQTAFNPDGSLIASIDGNEITIWRVHDGQRVSSIRTGSYTFAWSPDGQFIVSPEAGSEEQALGVWRVRDGQRVATLEGHTAHVFSVAWSPNGQTIASASGEPFSFGSRGDRTIRLWRTSDWQQVKTFRAHRDVITSLVFTPDGRQLISGSLDESIRWWKIE